MFSPTVLCKLLFSNCTAYDSVEGQKHVVKLIPQIIRTKKEKKRKTKGHIFSELKKECNLVCLETEDSELLILHLLLHLFLH